jgi:hypothetical protein
VRTPLRLLPSVGAIEARRLGVNKKHVQRLWREADLKVPAKKAG